MNGPDSRSFAGFLVPKTDHTFKPRINSKYNQTNPYCWIEIQKYHPFLLSQYFSRLWPRIALKNSPGGHFKPKEAQSSTTLVSSVRKIWYHDIYLKSYLDVCMYVYIYIIFRHMICLFVMLTIIRFSSHHYSCWYDQITPVVIGCFDRAGRLKDWKTGSFLCHWCIPFLHNLNHS